MTNKRQKHKSKNSKSTKTQKTTKNTQKQKLKTKNKPSKFKQQNQKEEKRKILHSIFSCVRLLLPLHQALYCFRRMYSTIQRNSLLSFLGNNGYTNALVFFSLCGHFSSCVFLGVASFSQYINSDELIHIIKEFPVHSEESSKSAI